MAIPEHIHLLLAEPDVGVHRQMREGQAEFQLFLAARPLAELPDCRCRRCRTLIGETERLAIWTCAPEYKLMIVVVYRVIVSKELEQQSIAVLQVEELHCLPSVMRCAARRRAVGRSNCRLQVMETACGVVFRYVLVVDGAIDLLNHLEVLMDRVAGVMRTSGPSLKLKPLPPVPNRN